MKKQKKGNGLIPVNNLEKFEPEGKLKKLNEIESIDSFEILDIEEKLDFAPPGGGCVNINIWCSY